MYEFDAGNRRRGSPKLLKAEHRTKSKLDRSMILLDQTIEVFGRPDLALIASSGKSASRLFVRRAHNGRIAEVKRMRSPSLAAPRLRIFTRLTATGPIPVWISRARP
jgi:hypothetical protein